MPDHSYFANLIWQIADLLRGPYRPPQYERVMLPMTALRRFDCVLAPLVRLPVFAQEVTRFSKGAWSSRLRLYPEGFYEVFLPVPSLREQREIVSHVARETGKLDALHFSTERTIALLKERRAALMAAAVTDKIDVGVAA
jgi:hypothetical protein